MSQPFFEVDAITVESPNTQKTIIRDVSLTVERGEVVAILGSSGAGKSTFLRAIAGLVPVVTGRIFLDGTDLAHTPTHKRDIGMMFQEHALFPHLDVGQNIAFGLKLAKVEKTKREARVSELLNVVGLDGFENRPIASLSGGERQRVALARTLAPSPRLLLLDEPMGSLDRVLRDRLVPELGEILRSLELAALYVTHDYAEAFALAHRIAVMDDGNIVQCDTPEVVNAAPVSSHVAGLLGHRSRWR